MLASLALEIQSMLLLMTVDITKRIIHLEHKLAKLVFRILFNVISKICCEVFDVFNNRIRVVSALDQNAKSKCKK